MGTNCLNRSWLTCLLLLLAFGCGDCEDEAGTTSNNGTGTTGDMQADDMQARDMQVSDASGTGDMSMVDAGTSCGIYSNLCDGACIPTNSDPDNCGGCDVVCGQEEVCFGGRCIEGCIEGLSECGRRCVDTENDNDNCGMCGDACPDGQGCVDSECVDAVDVDLDAQSCVGGGPPVDLGDALGESRKCAGNLAELTFRYGVCSCTDFDTNNALLVDAFDSNLGPYQPGGLGGGVGVNGEFVTNDGATITGTLWSASTQGMTFSGPVDIGLSLISGGDVVSNQEVTVGRDATIDGSLTVNQSFTVDRTLTLPTGETPPNQASFQSLVNADIDVALPCTECPPNALDVAGIVAAFTDPANNDNSVIGLDADVFNPADSAPQRLDLPCGRYVLNGIQSDQALTIVARGNTALFVNGDIVANNPITITLTPDAQLDVFVSGNVTSNNPFKLGSPDYPALMRVYVGGDEGFVSNNEVTLGGYVYAVPGNFTTNNELEVYGGVYAGDITANNSWSIHFDRRVTTVGDSCPDPDPDPDPNADMGTTPDPDPVCTTAGDGCMMDSECCTPLTCVNGTCQVLDCVPAFGACTDNAECCNGTCSGGADGICILN